MEFKPVARHNEILTQELNDELLVYDLKINKAYCLNRTLAAIWKTCDGRNSVTEISRKISREYKSPVSEDLIWLGLDELQKGDLLEGSHEIKSRFERTSRREMIRKAGLASMIALPMISSVIAPTAAYAQSPTSQNCRSDDFVTCYDAGCRVDTCAGAEATCNSGCTSGSLFQIDRCCSGAAYSEPLPSGDGFACICS